MLWHLYATCPKWTLREGHLHDYCSSADFMFNKLLFQTNFSRLPHTSSACFSLWSTCLPIAPLYANVQKLKTKKIWPCFFAISRLFARVVSKSRGANWLLFNVAMILLLLSLCSEWTNEGKVSNVASDVRRQFFSIPPHSYLFGRPELGEVSDFRRRIRSSSWTIAHLFWSLLVKRRRILCFSHESYDS